MRRMVCSQIIIKAIEDYLCESATTLDASLLSLYQTCTIPQIPVVNSPTLRYATPPHPYPTALYSLSGDGPDMTDAF